MTDPVLSVILTVVEGEPAISRCLQALADQQDPPPLEVLVPFDDTVKETADLAARFPQFTFMPLGSLIRTDRRITPSRSMSCSTAGEPQA